MSALQSLGKAARARMFSLALQGSAEETSKKSCNDDMILFIFHITGIIDKCGAAERLFAHSRSAPRLLPFYPLCTYCRTTGKKNRSEPLCHPSPPPGLKVHERCSWVTHDGWQAILRGCKVSLQDIFSAPSALFGSLSATLGFSRGEFLL
jgi:hypothetical protein